SVDAGVFFSSDVANPDTAAKLFTDVEMFTNSSSFPDAATYLRGWTCAEVRTKDEKWSGANYERFCNKAYDELHTQPAKEPDPHKRQQLEIQTQDILVNDVVVIPLAARKSVSGIAKGLKGISTTTWDSEMWNVADWSK